MAIVKFKDVVLDRWYNISLFADQCKANGRTVNPFEAKYDGSFWYDAAGVRYSVYSVIFIDDELVF